MPDEHDVLVDLVQQLQETANQLQDKVTELDTRTISLKDFDLTNHLNRVDQILTGVQERLDKLEGKK